METTGTAGDPATAIGRREHAEIVIAADKVDALAATLDIETLPGEGRELPPGWHWMFFNPFVRRSRLGPDGHPQRGGFLPETGLPRRMWAGGRLTYRAAIPVGARVRRESEIAYVVEKTGGSGRLVFVTVRHMISHEGIVAVEEEQDIVYRAPAAPDAAAPRSVPAPENPVWSERIVPDPVLLFRYSALTSNGHRIHYDQPYARQEEGYRDLVVHGPLIATLLQGLAGRARPDGTLRRFEFRAVAPLFVDRAFRIEAAESPEGLSLWARGLEGELAMRAEARFATGDEA
ncbi:MaoC family dehydratase N-terminal domain-containing protein [Rhizobiaceae bacterium BDR2-2]|uniref:MaoC family dehydratase N-terminal domain-containing protein n=1 Tax=Ectorhizobium quercum TaxID=2965071 RepID=A0AAE3MZY5_9HYPH|nr:MaoC family dehydratase N-terminal domain-containing protein [Ectorhizobium quercum]MCX8997199.1 MaoC family dehydratase N-terminal domain-containing protein [Ectorhizobium quercum]